MKIVIGAVLLAATQAATAAPAPPCMTKAEFTDLSLFVLPALLEGAANKCQALLPPDAYLPTGGRALAARLAAESDTHADGATTAFAKFGDGKLPDGISGDTVGRFVRDMARTAPFKQISARECAQIDEAAALLAPLPPQNLANLVRLILIASSKKDKNPPVRFCPTEAM
ncbi:hypothetical protein [Sphingosinicella sp. BN140058]|uniref:hypothetical protein n=1 Tax=Sphingosinicella sp. BN140058 TaxID=1892855 RepID=UPI001FB0E0DF|nr:hypothetical protein [Sphingosinicella sp. BN140058]